MPASNSSHQSHSQLGKKLNNAINLEIINSIITYDLSIISNTIIVFLPKTMIPKRNEEKLFFIPN
jgi:hypothetical protein